MIRSDFKVEKVGESVTGRIWRPGMPVLARGRWTAIDTETLMIDDSKPSEYPDMVLLTAYGGGEFTELVWWHDVEAYLAELMNGDSVFVFHNAPFDMHVTGMKPWVGMIDDERVIDTGIQWILHKITTVGLSDEADEYPKLSRVAQDVLGEVLEKPGEVRCTFSRDMDLDLEHAVYACGDAIATWKSAFVMSPDYSMPPTMPTQIKGFVALESISRNGILVDKDWMDNLRREYVKIMDGLKMTLSDFGINVDKELETKEIIPYVRDTVIDTLPDQPSIDDLRRLLVFLNMDGVNPPVFGKVQKDDPFIASWKENTPFGLPDKATKKQLVNVLWKAAMNIEEHKSPGDSMQEWWDSHDGWPSGYKPAGTTTQLQRLMAESERFCTRPLPKTESGMYALDEKALDMIPEEDYARLKFLKTYKDYKHAEKMSSTYLDYDKLVKADGRVHSRFIPIKATGRTSSRSPNLQNLPRDDRIRSCYIADPGYVLCSCDYNQQELIALAQVTYTRFGHSLMRDLINNDIDIHGFMGTTIKGLFKGLPRFDVTNDEVVGTYKKIIKDFKNSNPKEFKKLRQLAKALDDNRCRFRGRPLSNKKVNCRDGIVCLSAAKLLDGQTARQRKVHRLSRKGVGEHARRMLFKALLLRNE